MPADGQRLDAPAGARRFNKHDLDAIMMHFADDCVFESPRGPDRWGRRLAGKDVVRRGLAARFPGHSGRSLWGRRYFACGTRGCRMDNQRHHRRRGARRCARLRPVDLRARRQDRPQGRLLGDPRHVTSGNREARLGMHSPGVYHRGRRELAAGVGMQHAGPLPFRQRRQSAGRSFAPWMGRRDGDP